VLAFLCCLALVAFGAGRPTHARTQAATPDAGGGSAVNLQSSFADAATPGGVSVRSVREGVADKSRYYQLKQAANARAAAQPSGRVSSRVASQASDTIAPTISTHTGGLVETNSSPSDSNSAIGTSRYIETVNGGVGIYDTGLHMIKQSDVGALGAAETFSFFGDPEIIWDPATKKFYYVMMEQLVDSTWRLDIGYSKSASPNNADTDFCHYTLVNTADKKLEPDFPKIGGTIKHALIGVNFYDTRNNYKNSAVGWFTKPSSSTLKNCPGTPGHGWINGMPFTPVPSRSIDPSATGYVVASTWSGGNSLTVRTVTSGSKPKIGSARSVTVPAYDIPAQAEQPNDFALDTLDSRLTQVQLAFDPRLGRLEIWTSLATFAGAGSGVAWYEINPAGSLDQSGVASDPDLYVYNGTVSSDRAYKSATKNAFGSNMVLQATASSADENPSIVAMSKRGTSSASDLVTVKQGQQHLDFTCESTDVPCRWGDYSGLSPSPIAPLTGSRGVVYGVNMLGGDDEWTTENFVVSP